MVGPFNTLILFFSYNILLVYYMLYSEGVPMPSKVSINPEEPSLGRIRADYITPPHSVASFKLYLSRVERDPNLAYYANLLEDSCETPLKEGHISLRTNGPGLSPNKPMAIILTTPIPGPDGRYLIKVGLMHDPPMSRDEA